MSSEKQTAANRRNGGMSRGPRSAAGKTRASRNALRHGLGTISRHAPALFPEITRVAEALCPDASNPSLFEQALIIAETTCVLGRVRSERVARIERLLDASASPLSTHTSLERAKAEWQRTQLRLVCEWMVRAKPSGTKDKSTDKTTEPSKETNASPDGRACTDGRTVADAEMTFRDLLLSILPTKPSRPKANNKDNRPEVNNATNASPDGRAPTPGRTDISAETAGNAADSNPVTNPASAETAPAQKQQAAPPAAEPIPPRDEVEAMRLAMPDLARLERYDRRAWSRRNGAIRKFMQIKSAGTPAGKAALVLPGRSSTI